jgi:NAD+ synthase (glutamine-hydrolysing)
MLNRTVALAQIAPRLGDVRANLARHLEITDQARAAGADLVVFPELSLTGYDLQDLVPDVAIRRDGDVLMRLAAAAQELDLVVGFVEEDREHRFFNAAAYLSGGAVVHVHRKLHLPTYGLFQEGREFASGDTLRAFDTRHGTVGLLLCEDVWHSPTAWLLAQQGAALVVVSANGPSRGAHPEHGLTSVRTWRDVLRVTARFHTVFVAYVNRVGCEDGLTFDGGSMVVDPLGEIVAELAPLDEAVEYVSLNAGRLRSARTVSPLLRDARIDFVHREVDRLRRLRFDLPDDGADP